MRTRGLFLVAVALSWTGRPAHATTLVQLSLEQLSQAASEVICARVVGQETRWNELHTRIVTLTTLAVEQVFKGHAPATTEIEQPGGTIGNMHVHVAGTVRFPPQSRYLLFLEPSRGGPRYLVVGMMQGAFRIFREASSGQERVILPLGALIRGSSAAPIPQGGAMRGPTIPLQEFQRAATVALNAPLLIPRGTVMPVSIQCSDSRGVTRLHVGARTTTEVFPNPGVVIPAGSTVEGSAVRGPAGWSIHWDEISIRGRRVPISATSQMPAGASLAGQMNEVRVR